MNVEELVIDLVVVVYWLFGVIIVGWGVCVMVVEVEVYGGVFDGFWLDVVVYFYCGCNGCNDVMFGFMGWFYIYCSYGIYVCVNVVCGFDGMVVVVLFRVVVIEDGVEFVMFWCG